jgi:hypothetical protein
VPKNAVPVGTVAGLQLVAVLKWPVPGLGSQVCALAAPGANAVTATSAVIANSAALWHFSRLRATQRATQCPLQPAREPSRSSFEGMYRSGFPESVLRR